MLGTEKHVFEIHLKLNGCGITELSIKDALPTRSYLSFGSPAVVLGFPGLEGYDTQLYDEFSNFPVARHATIATWPSFTFTSRPLSLYKERCFLVDAKLHRGMSGSPVLSLPKSIYTKDGKPVNNDVNYYFAGILSAGSSELELHVVYWAELLEEVTKQGN